MGVHHGDGVLVTSHRSLSLVIGVGKGCPIRDDGYATPGIGKSYGCRIMHEVSPCGSVKNDKKREVFHEYS